jgi:hypothetical protein
VREKGIADERKASIGCLTHSLFGITFRVSSFQPKNRTELEDLIQHDLVLLTLRDYDQTRIVFKIARRTSDSHSAYSTKYQLTSFTCWSRLEATASAGTQHSSRSTSGIRGQRNKQLQ